MLYYPRNSQRNRQAGLVDQVIQLLDRKHGFAYFAVLRKGEAPQYGVSNEGLFEKEFQPAEEEQEAMAIPVPADLKQLHFLEYPARFGLQA
jgi:hypothetical protein